MTGWPENKTSVPQSISTYYDYHDELSVQDGIVLRGERVVIPSSMRADMKRRIHAGHLGIKSCLRRARDVVFWPGMSSEIRQFVESCHVCATYCDKQPQYKKLYQCMMSAAVHGKRSEQIYLRFIIEIIW